MNEVRGGDVLRLIEVADSSILHDLRVKAELDARHGVTDYWWSMLMAAGFSSIAIPRPMGTARSTSSIAAARSRPFPDLTVKVADLPTCRPADLPT
ncbi:MAG: hypothetical protein H7236_15110 [Gemmatimonadaceae bacterium]|nr:hypothetical protein [Caulobacter sp.]